VKTVDPLSSKEWNSRLAVSSPSAFFLSSEWARVLVGSYGYEPRYLVEIERGVPQLLLPIFHVSSALTGRRGVAIPFSDECPVIVSENVDVDGVRSWLRQYGNTHKWRYCEFHGGSRLTAGETPSSQYLGHLVRLGADCDQTYRRLPGSTRRNVRKATRQGVEIRLVSNASEMKEYYRIHEHTRRRHGLPPPSYSFFRNILEQVLSKNMGSLVAAYFRGKMIAGAIFFWFAGNAIFKYGGSRTEYLHLRPNNLIMWRAIEYLSQSRCRTLHLGRTHPGNRGLARFKAAWNAEEYPISYYRFDFKADGFISGRSGVPSFCRSVFRRLPTPVLRGIGTLVYPHIG
jgi:hypothetical protein